MNTVAGALDTAAVLNDLGKRAAARHMTVYGHNHAGEFSTKLMYDVTGDGVPESVPALEVVARNIDPRYVSLEVDVHWAYEGLGHDHFDGAARVPAHLQRPDQAAPREGDGRERRHH